MTKRHKKNKLKRYAAVSRRRIKRLTRKKAAAWFKKNLQQHPFILGLLFFIWLDAVVIRRNFEGNVFRKMAQLHLFILLAWLVLVVLSNLLKDKEKTRWYLKKRFIFFCLVTFPPLGLILLWSGSKFKKAAKISLSVIFISLFIFGRVYYNNRYERLMSRNPLEDIVEKITKPKKKIFLALAPAEVLEGFEFVSIPKKERVKLAASDIAARCTPGIVSIKTKDSNGDELGMGSGFVISKDGVIATNFHVLEFASSIEIKVGEREFKDARLIKSHSNLDLAVIKVDVDDLPALSVGDSDILVDGEVVVVLGNPWGFEHSVSTGIISAMRKQDQIKVIQMTAPVSPGSSGGPVINEYGEVVGVTTLASFFMAQNLNFAIPINYLKELINQK